MRLNDGRVIPAFIGQALRGEDLTIFGDGMQTRSFCYVDDQIEGLFRLLMSDCNDPINIGNPEEITIRDFAQEIINLTQSNQKVVYKSLPVDDPLQRQPDITRAKELLGWEPKISRSEGMKRTYQYFQSLPKEELFKTAHRDFSDRNKCIDCILQSSRCSEMDDHIINPWSLFLLLIDNGILVNCKTFIFFKY